MEQDIKKERTIMRWKIFQYCFLTCGALWGLIAIGESLAGIFGGLALSGIVFYVIYKIFAPQAYTDHCGAKLKKAQDEQAAKLQAKQQARTEEMTRLGIKCPTCSSSNIERISAGKKAAYVAATGILAPAFKKVRSQFECKNCGYKW